MTEHRFTNRLSQEKSPYLLQHAHNPVDWYPWGPEAFSRAACEDKPIFLSIGYSTCHWCHVMEKESFEDTEVAQFLNQNFIAIKVDREERPDVDHIYMEYCQASTGHGGWPLSIFLTPDKKPFFAGTYFPKNDRYGMSGFINVLRSILEGWNNNRAAIKNYSDKVINSMQQEQSVNEDEIDYNMAEEAFSFFKSSFDKTYGGFGAAPKFPSPHNLFFLIRYWYKTKDNIALEMVEKTLDSMYRGGIFDHIGFGFSRYSTDKKWLIPHFEKMLYDNALLAIACLETFQANNKHEYKEIAEKIFQYIIRDMMSAEGGFYSAEDADSEGVEGKFYVFRLNDIIKVLGDADGKSYSEIYDITEKGNFEDSNIPNLLKKPLTENNYGFAENCRRKLFEYRDKRVHPFKDDKILTSWNSLMIAALAIGGRILDNAEYTAYAEKAMDFLLKTLVREDGRLLARYRDGEASIPAYIDDYAFLVWSLIELYETTYHPEYLKNALRFNEAMFELFEDSENGGFYMYGNDAEELIMKPKEIYDGALPSGNSVAAMNLSRLSRLTGDTGLEEKAYRQLKAFNKIVSKAPYGFSFYLSALLYTVSKTREVIITGEADYEGIDEMIKLLKQGSNPLTNTIVYTDRHEALKTIIPSIFDYKAISGKATAYICQERSCQAPITDLEQFKGALGLQQ